MSEEVLLAAYSEILEADAIFTIQDESGIPTTENIEGEKTMPFWSCEEQAQAFIDSVKGYSAFSVLKVEWKVFAEKWLPGLDADGLLAGLNWQGETGAGFDFDAYELYEKVEENYQGDENGE